MLQYIIRLVLIKLLRGIIRSISAIGYFFYASRFPSPSHVTYYNSGARKLPIHVYQPDATDAAAHNIPVYINLHGGGFCIPGLGYDAEYCTYIANTAKCIVVDADYSKGPEYPWPAAVDDVDALIRWVSNNANKHGWDFERASIGGFSSGACLALLGAAGLEGKGLKAVAAFYPSTDLSEPPEDKPQLPMISGQAGGPITPAMRRLLYNSYLPPPLDRASPRVSPMFAPIENFPASVTIITCSQDSLAREATKFADNLTKGGKDVVHFEAAGQGHAWDKMARVGSDAERLKKEAYALVAKHLREAMWS